MLDSELYTSLLIARYSLIDNNPPMTPRQELDNVKKHELALVIGVNTHA